MVGRRAPLQRWLTGRECPRSLSMTGTIVSPYHHIYGEPNKPVDSSADALVSSAAIDRNMLAANARFLAIPWDSRGGGSFAVVPADGKGLSSSAIRATGCDLSHRPRSAPPASIWAMEFHPRHRPRFAQWTMSWDPPYRPQSVSSATISAGTLNKRKQSSSFR
jgi:hypothetical protein